MRMPAAAHARRAATARRGRTGLRLAGPRPLTVHGPRRELLGARLRRPALLGGFLDVLVLAGPPRGLLFAPLWGGMGLPLSRRDDARDAGPRSPRPSRTRATRAARRRPRAGPGRS